MKRSSIRLLATTGLLLGTAGVLVACGGSQTSSGTTYSYVYANDPNTLDYIQTNRATTADIVGNLVDGLLGNDQYGNFTPALAEDWTVSPDGLTYTYKLRKDAKWYTSDGEEYADVTADDFVTGVRYAVDSQSEALYLLQESIKGLDDYVTGKTNDFSTVGVKALDKYTVQYTLAKPEPYWNTKTTTTILYPVNAEFLAAKGKEFGKADPSSILYNGPYLLKSMITKSAIEYEKNPNYYDKEHVYVDKVKLSYFDGSDQESLIRNFKDGAYTVAGIFPNSSTYASVAKEYKDNIIYSLQDATTYFYNFNLDRKSYEHTAKTDEAQKKSTQQAVLNRNFRVAINYAIDRTSYSAQTNGKDAANKTLRNTYVPPTFVQIADKTYGEVVGEKLVGYSSEWDGIQLEDAQDAYYNVEKAKASFAKAKEELKAQGVSFPIHIDLPTSQTDKGSAQSANSIKQSIEAALGKENVVIDVIAMTDDELNNATYFASTAAQKDYDMNMSGWSPDYQDPATYLDTLRVDNGGTLQNFGFEPGQANEKIKEVGLDTYTAMLKEADKQTSDLTKRYEQYAQAEAWLIDNGILFPMVSRGGTPSVGRTVPYSRANSFIGSKGSSSNFKYLKLQKDIITVKQYEEATKKWRKEKEASNQKEQEAQKEHIK